MNLISDDAYSDNGNFDLLNLTSIQGAGIMKLFP